MSSYAAIQAVYPVGRFVEERIHDLLVRIVFDGVGTTTVSAGGRIGPVGELALLSLRICVCASRLPDLP